MQPRNKKKQQGTKRNQSVSAVKPGLHARNKFGARYDFNQLTKANPGLKPFVLKTVAGTDSIDFKNPQGVRELNKAILAATYGVRNWVFPEGYLCAPIPGRADYIHHLADLMAGSNDGYVPKGNLIKGLDIGVGATCIYPIIGFFEYGWTFVGTDIDHIALDSCAQILKSNPELAKAVVCRYQPFLDGTVEGAIKPNEYYDFTMSNPPFHKSADEAEEGTARKWKNLGEPPTDQPVLNFGGKDNELNYPGGEIAFIRKMIMQSEDVSKQCFWFTTLVSQKDNLAPLIRAVQRAHCTEFKVIEMAQGQKVSRILAWTFLNDEEREKWRQKRWLRDTE